MRSGKTKKRNSSTSRSSGFFVSLWRFGRQKFTIMLVPHSEKNTMHFQISLISLFFLGILFFGLLAGFFWFSLDFSGQEALLATRSRDLAETEAKLNLIQDEVEQLVISTDSFRGSLDGAMDILGLQDTASDPATSGGGDLASIFSIQETNDNTLAEVSELQTLRVSLDKSVMTLNDIGSVLSSQKDLLSDIPTIWPLKGVRGRVTQIFGPSIHPFHKYWYLHRGIDLGFGMGVPIVATANGKVLQIKFDANGFGRYIDIQHKYGFKTRYAHLQREIVVVGQQVNQGEIIGTMGNSGASTGPHLHYEVMIGTQLVDPAKFLTMVSSDSMGNVVPSLHRHR